MATRKQLKRERKRRTHGIERMVPDTAVQETTEKQPSTRGRGRTAKPAANPAHRGRKPVAYPTIWRALKRAPLLAAFTPSAFESHPGSPPAIAAAPANAAPIAFRARRREVRPPACPPSAERRGTTVESNFLPRSIIFLTPG